MAKMTYTEQLEAIKGIGPDRASLIVGMYPNMDALIKAKKQDLIDLLPDNVVEPILELIEKNSKESKNGEDKEISKKKVGEPKKEKKVEESKPKKEDKPIEEEKKEKLGKYTIGRRIAAKIDGRDVNGIILADLGEKVEASIRELGGMPRILDKKDIQVRPLWINKDLPKW